MIQHPQLTAAMDAGFFPWSFRGLLVGETGNSANSSSESSLRLIMATEDFGSGLGMRHGEWEWDMMEMVHRMGMGCDDNGNGTHTDRYGLKQ